MPSKINLKITSRRLLVLIFFAAFALLVLSISISFTKNRKVPEDAVVVMTYNIGNLINSKKVAMDELVKIIGKVSPDIIMLQEAYGSRGQELAKRLGYSILKFKGMGHVNLLSRLPMKLFAAKRLTGYQGDKNLVCGEIDVKGKKVLACSVHLSSIFVKRSAQNGKVLTSKTRLAGMFLREILFSTKRSKEAEELVKWVKSQGYKNIVIGGDFNSFFVSKAIRIMTKDFYDTAWLTPAFFSSSHKPVLDGWSLPIKVDYIFVSKNIRYSGSRIIKESPGDHYPVITSISLN